MSEESLQKTVLTALEDLKARDIVVMDVRAQTTIADSMVIASGSSDRHVRSIAEHVVDKCRESGQRPLGVEGLQDGEWVLVDLDDIVVHVMLPRVRDFYNLEKLWTPPARPGRVSAKA
jgi:ribosome-associated protein